MFYGGLSLSIHFPPYPRSTNPSQTDHGKHCLLQFCLQAGAAKKKKVKTKKKRRNKSKSKGEAPAQIFECERDCGFRGSFEDVSKHEAECKFEAPPGNNTRYDFVASAVLCASSHSSVGLHSHTGSTEQSAKAKTQTEVR